MSEVRQSVMAATGVVACAAAVLIGAATRNRNDIGGTSGLPPYAMQASTSNQDVPAADYFYELSEKLKKEYVEPVTDNQKLASGAVRGMVTSLGDPKSLFMGKEEFQAYLNARQGSYEGIGVDIALVMPGGEKQSAKASTSETESNEASAEEALALGFKIPRVMVTNVVPGGPADKAGVKAGDFVYSVDEHWVANTSEVAEFRRTQKAFLDKKINREAYNKTYKALRKKMDRALMPTKVIEKLIVGTGSNVQVVWDRAKAHRSTVIAKAKAEAPGFSAPSDTIRLPFTAGSPDALRKALEGKSAVTIDLRHNVNGDFNAMRECLALVAPSGKYGTLGTDKKEKPSLLIVEKGTAKPIPVTLLVDQTTGGAAEIFALALSSKERAKLSGTQMSGDRSVRQVVQLPDGSGYTLVTAIYKPEIEQNTILARGDSK
ncbi:MAG: S41 family peptidase [Fimbriimonas sp.]